MKSVNKSVLIWYSPQEMFALVRDVTGQPVTSQVVARQQTRLSLEFHDGRISVQRGGDD